MDVLNKRLLYQSRRDQIYRVHGAQFIAREVQHALRNELRRGRDKSGPYEFHPTKQYIKDLTQADENVIIAETT